MAGTIPDSVLGLAIFVDILGGFAIIIGSLFCLMLWIRGERFSHIMLLSATCVLGSIVNFIRHIDYTVNWKYIMIERFQESQDPTKLALELVGTTSCGWRMAVDYLLLYFYDVQSLIVASWTAALLIDSYDIRLKTETKETFFIASRICAPILPAIVVGVYCSETVENNLPAYLVLTNVIRVISLAVASAMVLAVLYKYLTITRGLGSSAATTPTQTPRSSVASKKRKSSTHAGLSLVIRFALIIMILMIFEASVIAVQMVGYYTRLETGKPKGPDFSPRTARVQLGVCIPALMPSILLAFIFGTTKTFRDQYRRMILACFGRRKPRNEPEDSDVECIVMEPPKPTEAMQSQCSRTIANLKGLPELDFPKPTEAMQSQCSKTIAFLKESPGVEPPKPTEAMQTQCSKTIAFLRGDPLPIEPPKPTEAMQTQCSKTIAFLRGDPPPIEPPKPTEAMQSQCSKTIAFLRGDPPPIEPPKPTEAMQTQCSKTIAFLRGDPPPIEPPKPTEAMQQQCSKTIAFLRGEPEKRIEPPKPTEAMQQQCSKTIAFLRGESTGENEQASKPTGAVQAQEATTAELLKPSADRPVTAVRLSKVSPVVIDVPPNARRNSERRSSHVVSLSDPYLDSRRFSTKVSNCHSHDCQSGLCEEGRKSEQLRRDTLHHIENTISKPPSSPGFPPRKSSLASERSLGSTPGYKSSNDQSYAQYCNAPASPSPLTPASYRTFASDAQTLTSSPTAETFACYSQTPQTPLGPRQAYTSNRPPSMHWSQATVERPQDSPSLSPTQQQQPPRPRPRSRPQSTTNPFLAPFMQISGTESPSTSATQQTQPRPRSRPQSSSTTNPFLAPFAQITAAAGHERRPSMPTRVEIPPPQPAVNPNGQRGSWHERRSTEPSWPLRD